MNQFTFDEIQSGQTVEFHFKVPVRWIDDFAEISGDKNPLHVDEVYARSAGQPGRVVHGMLSSSLFSRLVGMYLPGKNCLLLGIDLSFHKPVMESELLVVTATVVEKHDAFKLLTLKGSIKGTDGDTKVKAKIKVKVREDHD